MASKDLSNCGPLHEAWPESQFIQRHLSKLDTGEFGPGSPNRNPCRSTCLHTFLRAWRFPLDGLSFYLQPLRIVSRPCLPATPAWEKRNGCRNNDTPPATPPRSVFILSFPLLLTLVSLRQLLHTLSSFNHHLPTWPLLSLFGSHCSKLGKQDQLTSVQIRINRNPMYTSAAQVTSGTPGTMLIHL